MSLCPRFQLVAMELVNEEEPEPCCVVVVVAWGRLVAVLHRVTRLRRLFGQVGAHLRMIKDRGRQ